MATCLWGEGRFLHFVLPVLSLTAFNLAVLLRLTRSSVLDILGLDFLRTARAKGLPAALVNIRHALPNALLPIISAMGVRLGAMLSGVIVVEVMFAWPGIGKLLYDAVLQRDIPIVVGGVISNCRDGIYPETFWSISHMLLSIHVFVTPRRLLTHDYERAKSWDVPEDQTRPNPL